jgi:exonuclease III
MAAVDHPAAPPLTLVSKNVGGLSSCKDKRARLFVEMGRKRRCDVFLLQETHSASAGVVRQWAAEAGVQAWQGPQFWHHGTSASCGVAILIRDTAPVSDAKIGYQDAHGRILRVDFLFAGVPTSVINVYAPCVAAERAAFFTLALPLAMPDATFPFVGGDFNCVLREDDRWGAAVTHNRFVGRDQLEAFMVMYDVEDSWGLPPQRGKPPRGRQHTFHTNVASADGSLTFTAARLDRWLTPVPLREWVQDTVIRPLRSDFLPGDHGAVILRVQPPQQPPRGPGVWSLPLHVLNDAAYRPALSAHLAAFEQQHAHRLSHRDFWEAVKVAVADFTHAFCFNAALRKRLPEVVLRRSC